MIDISVCMIVKNEEDVLGRCLDGLKNIADEIIIVDTGSEDGTKKVASKYTDKVYDFEWVNDFAKARNFSIEKAACEYIYVADADEVVTKENALKLLKLKQLLLPEIDIVEMQYMNMLDYNTTANFKIEYRPKMFRRMRPFLFVDPIHEVLRTDPLVYTSDIVINHCPTSSHGERDLEYFARLVNEGEPVSQRLEMMYSRELLLCGEKEDFEVAKKLFSKIAKGDYEQERIMRAACVLAHLAVLEFDAKSLLKFAAPQFLGTPPAEICCDLGDYFFADGDYSAAANWFVAASNGAVAQLVAASAGSRAYIGLASCYEKVGEMDKADEFRQLAQQWAQESWDFDENTK